ncbi:MAG: hypothetical protein ACTHK2_16610 [Dokdonella sp.]
MSARWREVLANDIPMQAGEDANAPSAMSDRILCASLRALAGG